MSTGPTTPEIEAGPDGVRCGCCGMVVAATKATELMNTPGTFICSGCARWAAARSTAGVDLITGSRRVLARLWHARPRRGQRPAGPLLSAIPILTTTDVDRTCAYYTRLCFELVERYDDGYLLMQAGDHEVHFATGTLSSAPGEMFVHVRDARALRKQLKADDVEGLGPVEDRPWGLREFVAVDPDGNRIRFGSPPAGE